MDFSGDQIGFISWNQHCMKFYFRILILFAVGQMQPRLAQLIHFGYAPAEHPVSAKWLSMCLSLSIQLNPGDFTASLCWGISTRGQDSHKERACSSTFLFQDFSCFEARSVIREAMGWHRLWLTLEGFGVSKWSWLALVQAMLFLGTLLGLWVRVELSHPDSPQSDGAPKCCTWETSSWCGGACLSCYGRKGDIGCSALQEGWQMLAGRCTACLELRAVWDGFAVGAECMCALCLQAGASVLQVLELQVSTAHLV